MLKKFLSVALVLLLGAAFFSEAFAAKEVKKIKKAGMKAGMKVGMTVEDLTNPVWAATCNELNKLIKAEGGKYTILDSKGNPTTQISQLENFINNKVDVVIVHAVAPSSVEPTLRTARAKGIKVFSWDNDLKNADVVWLIKNYDLGKAIAKTAADWINTKHKGSCEVAILNHPELPIIKERGDGIEAGLKEYAPKAKVVAIANGLNITQAMTQMETIFQAHPKVKVVACIGGNLAVAANEVVKATGRLKPDIGIFAADASPQELEAIAKNEAIRSSIIITGTPKTSAREIYGLIKKLYEGKPVERNIYRKFFPVNKDNYKEFI
ncbi:MAG: sugar ABC transporter substrate-binding protein [Endomicrobium sp.]|jgi:ribose transport system substrate-binding protein|nr:sugar ABC transporter substrate-binding protein [Endomicrobium sp.]